MTVDTLNTENEVIASGVQNVFYFTFHCDSPSWVKIYFDGVEYLDGTVALNANQSASPGGTVTTLAFPVNGTVVLIERNVPLTQDTDYPPYTRFPAQDHEEALDKLTMINQQLNAGVIENTDNIAINEAAIDANTINIAANTDQIAINTGDIATNVADIGTNADNIVINASAISTINNIEMVSSDEELMTIAPSTLGGVVGDLSFNFFTNAPNALLKLNALGEIDASLLPPAGGNEFVGSDPTLSSVNAAIISGTDKPLTDPQIALGPSLIQAKSDEDTATTLKLNELGGIVEIGGGVSLSYDPGPLFRGVISVPTSNTVRLAVGSSTTLGLADDIETFVQNNQIRQRCDETEFQLRETGADTDNLISLRNLAGSINYQQGYFQGDNAFYFACLIQSYDVRFRAKTDINALVDYLFWDASAATLSARNTTTGAGLERVLTESDIQSLENGIARGAIPDLTDTNAALVVTEFSDDPDSSDHLEFGPTVIQSKSNATTAQQLQLNPLGGAVKLGNESAETSLAFMGANQKFVWVTGATGLTLHEADSSGNPAGLPFINCVPGGGTPYLELYGDGGGSLRTTDFGALILGEARVLDTTPSQSDALTSKAYVDSLVGSALAAIPLATEVTKTSSTSYTNVPEWAFSMEANSTYRIRGLIIVDDGSGSGGARFRITSDQSDDIKGVMRWSSAFSTTTNSNSVGAGSTFATLMPSGAPLTGLQMDLNATIVNGGTAANITFGFGQETSDADSSILVFGSYIEITRLD